MRRSSQTIPQLSYIKAPPKIFCVWHSARREKRGRLCNLLGCPSSSAAFTYSCITSFFDGDCMVDGDLPTMGSDGFVERSNHTYRIAAFGAVLTKQTKDPQEERYKHFPIHHLEIHPARRRRRLTTRSDNVVPSSVIAAVVVVASIWWVPSCYL